MVLEDFIGDGFITNTTIINFFGKELGLLVAWGVGVGDVVGVEG